MKKKYFGTDGIRGEANKDFMTGPNIMKLGTVLASLFNRGSHRHIALIGKDTRLSGYMLEPALTAGFISAGMDVVLAGPLPTPAIAMLTKSLRADIGIMISASHNPYQDNGIKIFGPDGYKLSDDLELKIEERFDSDISDYLATSKNIGKAKRLTDAAGRYIESVKSSFPKGKRLDGLKIVIDCANGATYQIGPTILWELGAEVISIGTSPNGFNINKNYGSEYTDNLSKSVIENRADIGIALDGDGDRVIIVDELGNIIDGDQLMAIIAMNNYALDPANNSIVTTVMSNIGLGNYLKSNNIDLIRTDVGDRHVMQKMRELNIKMGGEQSGHIILSEYSMTGDGLIAALQILSVLNESKKPASQILNVFKPSPQILKNIRLKDISLLDNKIIQDFIDKKKQELSSNERILVRKSGTEPLVRIMVEGDNIDKIQHIIDEIADKFFNLEA